MKNFYKKIFALTLLTNFFLLNLAYAHVVPPDTTTKKCPDNHILLGDQCYDLSSEELFDRVKRAAAIQDPTGGPGGSICPSEFYFISGKCYKGGTPQYNEVLKQASAAARAREAQGTEFALSTSTLKIGKIAGKVHAYETSVKIPCQPSIGPCPSEQTPAGYIARLYTFGLMIAGFAAFASIIYGSLKYILSAGNIGSQQDAKDQITQAVMGLLLLLGAFLILYTINPELVNLRNPNLEFIKINEIIGEDQAENLGGQKLLTGGKPNEDLLCALSLNANVNVSANNIPGVTSGEKSSAPACLNCKENAHRTGGVLGVGGTCVCNTNYAFDPATSECLKFSLIVN